MSRQVDCKHLELREVELANQRVEVLELRAEGVQKDDWSACPRAEIAQVAIQNARTVQFVGSDCR